MIIVRSLAGALALALIPVPAFAQEPAPAPPSGNAGGHIGIATPLVTVSDETTTIADAFTILNPIGVGVKVSSKVVVDFEVVVATPVDPDGDTGLVVDPGVVYNFGAAAAGLRLAFQIGQPANVGLIPLINKGFVDLGGATWFAEAAFPTFYSQETVAFNVVLHTGIGF